MKFLFICSHCKTSERYFGLVAIVVDNHCKLTSATQQQFYSQNLRDRFKRYFCFMSATLTDLNLKKTVKFPRPKEKKEKKKDKKKNLQNATRKSKLRKPRRHQINETHPFSQMN